MPNLALPKAAIPAALPRDFRLQIVSTSNGAIPDGEGWLHEIKHDGFRMAAIFDGRGGLKLISRQGLDHTSTFRALFQGFAASGLRLRPAAPGRCARSRRRPQRRAVPPCALRAGSRADRGRPAHRRAPAGSAGILDHVIGRGAELFDRVAALGGEGIVSKRLGRPYRGGESRDWLKTKVFEMHEKPARAPGGTPGIWGCDAESVVAAFGAEIP